jgi:NAD-dependent dihydropyrimidine dehydrogenase PreA subunit
LAKKIIIRIDEAKCDGCGKCVVACHEGVIKIINGKAKVVNESSCDGLGACIGECPQGAVTIKEVKQATLPCGCPGAKAVDLRRQGNKDKRFSSKIESQLQNWPIQLQLLNPDAPFLKNAELLIAADCVGFSYPNFHDKLLKGKTLINFCPKLDTSMDVYRQKLTSIFEKGNIKSLTIAHMEVPCCFGLVKVVKEAIEAVKKEIPFEELTIFIRGDKKEE